MQKALRNRFAALLNSQRDTRTALCISAAKRL
jgi:hypothetical protein